MKPSAGRAILGGMVATPVMTVFIYVAGGFSGVNMDIAAMLGNIVGGSSFGFLAHLLNGSLVFRLVYVWLLYRSLAGPPVVRGLTFAAALWLISETVAMPLMGAGFFNSHMGGLTAAVISLAGHLQYGAILGVFSGREEEQELKIAASNSQKLPTMVGSGIMKRFSADRILPLGAGGSE